MDYVHHFFILLLCSMLKSNYYKITLAVFTLLSLNIYSQETPKDTIQLLNGEQLITTVADTVIGRVKITRADKKGAEDFIETQDIFSIKFANGFERIYYFQDTLLGNDLTVEETRYFIYGERDARNYKVPGSKIGAFVVGAAAPIVGLGLLSVIPSFGFTATTMIPRVKIRESTVSDYRYLEHPTYVLGYERVAKKKRIMGALSHGGIGLALGFATYLLLK